VPYILAYKSPSRISCPPKNVITFKLKMPNAGPNEQFLVEEDDGVDTFWIEPFNAVY